MNKPDLTSRAEQIYDAIYEEEDARVCKDISEQACTNVPSNFFLQAGATSLGKFADAVANTKTTLPWLLSSVGAPGWIVPLLVPIRESGSMLPQMLMGAWVRNKSIRKHYYTIGACLQAASLLIMALSLITLEGALAGLLVLTGLIIFSLSRGLCSIASKDVVGKTVPKNRRGRVNGLSSSISGFGMLLVIGLMYASQLEERYYAMLIAAAALFWLGAAYLYTRIEEEPGATEGGINGLSYAQQSLELLRTDIPFRNFVICRSLFIGTGLAAPFFVLMAQARSEAELLYFMAAQGVAALISGPFWGRYADQSSKSLMLASGLAAGTLGLLTFSVEQLYSELTFTPWFLPLCFFLLMLVHDGMRIGRKTYLLDLGDAEKRTDYVAVSNTIIGIVLLVSGLVTSLVTSSLDTLGNPAAILIFSLLAFWACYWLRLLPEVQN